MVFYENICQHHWTCLTWYSSKMLSIASSLIYLQWELVLFNSPHPKAYVRYCHHLASVVVCILLPFNLLLWNHWTNWNQIWEECSLDGPLLKVYVFLFIRRNKRSNGVQKGCIYMYGNKLFIVHLFLMSFF